MTLGQRLDRALLRMSMFAEGATVDTTKDRISSGKTEASAPTDYQPLGSEWQERAKRLVESIEREAEAYATGAELVPRKSASDLRAVIRNYEGRDCVFVAYHEGCSVDLVRKVRASLGLDSHGGKKPPSLTSREVPVTPERVPEDYDWIKGA